MKETQDHVIINNLSYDLEALEKDCWTQLVNGANKSRDSFHTPCIATLNKGESSLRTVVLRKAFPLEKELRFHTDTRSPKWDELRINPSISGLFYDAAARIQLRIKGKAELHHTDEITTEAWKKTALSSRRCYLTDLSPSSFIDFPSSGLSTEIEQDNFTWEDSEIGQQNFGVVCIHVESIDWLYLHHAGHRRAFFDYVQNHFQWMIP